MDIQGGQGTTQQRMGRGKVVTVETINAGERKQIDAWPDIVAFMVDEGMLLADDSYGWDDYCRLRSGGGSGSGNGGEGWKQQEWIRFGQLLGRARLNWLNELWDYPVPSANDQYGIKGVKWRLNRCMHLIRDGLAKASDAAQRARMEINGLRSMSD